MADTALLIDQLLALDENPLVAGPALDHARAVVGAGLPSRRSEAWKYTNVDRWYDAIERNAPPTPLQIEAANIDVDMAPASGIATNTRFDVAEFPLAAINQLLLTSTASLHARTDSRGRATISAGGAYQHLSITADPHSEIVLIEDPADYTFRRIDIRVGRGARVSHFRRATESDGAGCTLVTVEVDADATYRTHGSLQGAALRRIDLHIVLAGAGAHATVESAWRISGRRHLDQQVAVSHQATDTTSEQRFRGVADDRATGILNGRIHIARDAQRSHAELSTKNLLESPTAKINAKPELEIYADDVRCSHGATIGAMDEEALFYLRSRGIDAAAARQLLLRSFLGEALHVPTSVEHASWMP